MIVRILGEGQLLLDDSVTDELNQLDADLEAAVEADDDVAFRRALDALLGRVRAAGTQLAADTIAPSDLILPQADATRDEVRQLLTDEGLIAG